MNNLSLLCSIAYFIWMDMNNLIFQYHKPLPAHTIMNQAISSLLYNLELDDSLDNDQIYFPQ